MKVAFNPVVNFKQNLIEEKMTNSPEVDALEPANTDCPSASIKEDNAEAAEDKFVYDMSLEEKIADFQSALKDRKWEKKYLPESDLVFIKQKKVEGGIEYILEKDGTVRETGADLKSTVIMEPSSKMAKEFGKIKAKQDSDPKEKKAGNWLTRGISDMWTALSVAGTMTVATAKGVFYGVITGAGVLAGATILNVSKLVGENKKLFDILKNPIKSAGKGGRIVAAVASLAVLASYVISGKLTANENAAVIDHKMHTGHRDA